MLRPPSPSSLCPRGRHEIFIERECSEQKTKSDRATLFRGSRSFSFVVSFLASRSTLFQGSRLTVSSAAVLSLSFSLYSQVRRLSCPSSLSLRVAVARGKPDKGHYSRVFVMKRVSIEERRTSKKSLSRRRRRRCRRSLARKAKAQCKRKKEKEGKPS